jgi:hypothetical protein
VRCDIKVDGSEQQKEKARRKLSTTGHWALSHDAALLLRIAALLLRIEGASLL